MAVGGSNAQKEPTFCVTLLSGLSASFFLNNSRMGGKSEVNIFCNERF